MQFFEFMNPGDNDKILEVGIENKEHAAVANYLIKKYPYPNNITALGIGDLSEFQRNYPDVKTIVYDGKTFPFKDKSFDIVHSNAVIEHVGKFEAQKLFLKEMIRVSKRGMINTPNRYFPIESHTRILFLHWAPQNIYDRCLNLIGKTFADSNYINLLDEKQIRQLMKQMDVKNFKIIKNRFMGVTMTFSVLWNCDIC